MFDPVKIAGLLSTAESVARGVRAYTCSSVGPDFFEWGLGDSGMSALVCRFSPLPDGRWRMYDETENVDQVYANYDQMAYGIMLCITGLGGDDPSVPYVA